MNLIFCLDNSGGMLFGGHRQSRDSAVIEDVFSDLNGEKLYVLPFSQKLFLPYGERVSKISSVEEIPENATVFCEDVSGENLPFNAEKIIVYKWNRDYPADVFCGADFSLYELVEETDFSGTSHEKITKKVYCLRG